MPGKTVSFLDLWGTLLLRTPRGVEVSPVLLPLLTQGVLGRVGLLCNLPEGQGVGQVRTVLAAAGIESQVDSQLIVVASALGTPLPDRRAFAAAAAIAEVSLEDCLYLSADQSLVIAALAGGMRGASVVAPPTPAPAPAVAAPGAVLAAGEIDEDRGPAYILQGRLVTMRAPGEVINDGRIVIKEGQIRAVLDAGEPLPEACAGAPVIDTKGTIYPGLMDLHNHFVYNVLPLWVVPKLYSNRSQWPRHVEYKSRVSMPIKDVLTRSGILSGALLRYVEAKALIGGATTGQGILTGTKGGHQVFYGAMRNVEVTKDDRLPEAGTRVPDLATAANQIETFHHKLQTLTAYFYHLAEGIDDSARQHFLNLQDHQLVAPALVGIHALGLNPRDLDYLADKGAKIVWSPFSNLLLYGQTLDLRAVKDSGVHFSIGCDWSPTGSKNLLQELKVARFENARQGSPLTDFELVAGVTSQPAATLGWDKYLGMIKVRAMADLLVLSGQTGDPLEQILQATEANVRLVTVHGIPRYGDFELLSAVPHGPKGQIEEWRWGNSRKAFYLYADLSPINEVTFAAAVERLQDAMRDLPGTLEQIREGTLAAAGIEAPPELVIELDNELDTNDPFFTYDPGPEEPALLAEVQMADSLVLDEAVVGAGDYEERLEKQPNISGDLKRHLQQAY
jgi:5-methylthioadenosine/S-adenosylhomocysteine deaminase